MRPARLVPLLVILGLGPTLLPAPLPAGAQAPPFAGPGFAAVWRRADQPVADGRASRTWLWGPAPFTEGVREPYAQSPGGARLVQYFDKARMEINDPGAPTAVTNGLLARELISGQLQVGDAQSEARAPADVNVAGDLDDALGPTYASFGRLLGQAPPAIGAAITATISRDGSTGDAGDRARYGVTAAYLVPETNQAVASVFWDYLNSVGPVQAATGARDERLFEPTFFATGLPIARPYWARVKVANQTKDVLIQAFERRVLTYTPDNPAGWQVEMGNVGRHYHQWRSGAGLPPAPAPAPAVQSLRPDTAVRRVLDLGASPPPVRIAKDPRDNALHVLKANGDIVRVDPAAATAAPLYAAADHGVANAQGLAIGPDGTIYLVGNEDRPDSQTRATIVKGAPAAGGRRAWSILAQTADYPRSVTAFDHRFNGIVVSPDGAAVYVNSGSRTDHGEVQSAGGRFPEAREVGLTAGVFRLPTGGQDLRLPNDRAALRQAGYVFAEGTRNSFDLAFAPNGDLIAPDNGPDRDMSDELNWLQAGGHYGYPWRIGGADNPQQDPRYDPATDRLLDARFIAVRSGFYHNDPSFPTRPAGPLIEPIPNLGPDADRYRDPADGRVKDASAAGQALSTFTSHRAPLGLVFDGAGALAPEFRGDGFLLSWTPGDPDGEAVDGPFRDAGQDLLHLDLTKTAAGAYQLRATRLVGGFALPIDAEIIGNTIYVLEYGGNGGLWAVTLPATG